MSIKVEDLTYSQSDTSESEDDDVPGGFGNQEYNTMIAHREAARRRMIENARKTEGLPNKVALRALATQIVSDDSATIELFKETIDMIDATYAMVHNKNPKKEIEKHINNTLAKSKEVFAKMRKTHNQLASTFGAYNQIQDAISVQKREMVQYVAETDRQISQMENDPNAPH